MVENDLEFLVEEKPRKFHFDWLIPILYKPRRIMQKIGELNHNVWIVPILLLMVTATVMIIVSAQLTGQVSQPATTPEMYDYYSPEQQQQFQDAVAMGASPVMTIIFPLLGRFLGIWVSWFLLGSILHLSLTLNGSRSSNRTALNVVAWASIPFVIRDVVQIVAMLITRQTISAPGLSGFMTADATGFSAIIRILLGFVDIYLIWQIILVGIGARETSGLKASKAWLATLIAMIIFLALKALPGFIGSQISSISTGGFFF